MIFSKLLNFLKRNKNVVKIGITKEIYSNTTICIFEDLYKVLGITTYVDQIRKDGNGKYHVDNLRINKKTYEKIKNLLYTNLCSKKNKWAKIFRKNKLMTEHSFDCLLFSPMLDETVSDDTIQIYLPGHKKYKDVNE